MRLKIHFKLTGKKQLLPLNYQYPISSWIYKVLGNADSEFTNILHNIGYQIETGKTFKLFTFSNLGFPNHTWKIIPQSDRMQVWARKAWIEVRFHLPEPTEKFIMGLFKEQKVFIGDKISGIVMEVEGIEAQKVILPKNNKVAIRTATPLILGIKVDGEKNEQYLPPTHIYFKGVFLQNLIDKLKASGKSGFKIEDIDFKLLRLHKNKDGKPKTKKITIKAFTDQQTEVKGFFFDFELIAPKEIIEIGLNSGFGSMNSLGFGFGEDLALV